MLPAQGGRPCVLVAEDGDDLRLLVRDELRREGLDVVGCASGREAVRQAEWIERIGWPRLLKMAGIPFQKEYIEDYKHAGPAYERSTDLTF